MMKQVHAPGKRSCSTCKSRQPEPSRFAARSFANRAEDSDLTGDETPRSLPYFNLMSLPLHAPVQSKLADGMAIDGKEAGNRVVDPATPIVQRYVKVGLYEGVLGLDHIGVGVNTEKTKGFSPKAGLGREAEAGSWVEGEVKEDEGLIDSLTINTILQQEAKIQEALNRSVSASPKFNLYEHNCAQHGAEMLKSGGLEVKSSPMPRTFFAGLKSQFGGEGSIGSKKESSAVEGEPLQGKFGSNGLTTQPMQSKPKPNRTGMPDGLKAGIESLSGIDMSDVRVHANSDRPARLNALAYTQGNQIYLGPGQERHLPHEAWHAVQQKKRQVRATGQMMGVGVNDDGGLEEEADKMGAQMSQKNYPNPRSGLTAQLKLAIKNSYNTIQLVSANLTHLNVRGEHKANLYKPVSPTTTASFYCHGIFHGDIDAITGVKLGYYCPHGSTLSTNVLSMGNSAKHDANDPNLTGKWHNYILSSAAIGLDAQEIQKECVATNSALAVIIDSTTTKDIVTALKNAGYVTLKAIHCREILGQKSMDWDPLTNAEIVVDPGEEEVVRNSLNGKILDEDPITDATLIKVGDIYCDFDYKNPRKVKEINKNKLVVVKKF